MFINLRKDPFLVIGSLYMLTCKPNFIDNVESMQSIFLQCILYVYCGIDFILFLLMILILSAKVVHETNRYKINSEIILTDLITVKRCLIKLKNDAVYQMYSCIFMGAI